VKETCHAIYQQLNLTIRGFSTIEFMRYHGEILTVSLKKQQRKSEGTKEQTEDRRTTYLEAFKPFLKANIRTSRRGNSS
jgi:hypothetical protein